MSFHLKIVTDWSNHEQLSTISANQYLGLIEPSMSSKISCLWQFLHLLVGLE